MKIWENIKLLLVVLFLISIPMTLFGAGAVLVGGFFPQETSYQYEVKAQQVFDGDRVEDSDVTEFEELSADEQDVLFRAFKKSDHFMGTSQVTVYNGNERLDTFTNWRTVESNGVLLLVAINEHQETQPDTSEHKWYHWMVLYSMIYCMVGFFVILFLPPM
ncbi:hypothetical protein M199_gp129 [Halogranum tailed virus 1]|uniref:DUF7979 domain-containing protein n=1 Tax=Halogranum tailed virus 1 TaxID=1273749 RepID=R4TLH0_9CAUD|nr:hypothetical protein M199_gp129 [Halogranum tailed virus 1]AGM11537.1 hypothetical protein HGTV1_240 [Halogranum tailed virus 1]